MDSVAAVPFYRNRRVALLGLCLLPVVLVGTAWWVVNEIVLARPIPGATAGGEEAVQFIAHEKGLVRLSEPERFDALQQILRRAVAEPTFRNDMVAALRRSTADEVAAFRANIFDTFKPVLMKDVRAYQALNGGALAKFIDERIVAYNRMGAFFANTRVDKQSLVGVLPEPKDVLALIFSRTTEEERNAALAYQAVLAQRIEQILADPALKAEFEARIAASDP